MQVQVVGAGRCQGLSPLRFDTPLFFPFLGIELCQFLRVALRLKRRRIQRIGTHRPVCQPAGIRRLDGIELITRRGYRLRKCAICLLCLLWCGLWHRHRIRL